ncbi:hypothetical protein DFJ58DRAFT_848097 [Suillus subalutaceus]|uniref:uncharacterized protein n=1 Tax=Suillus subalutaceus TaxID=48586 RepID=UPI001B8742B0|nr:uncharacterized protein DFJ58DRAFT_848097 [Suillus subalutaceus]KAG1831969.1 hypothetical protein DFJ58DRAFT_848097 [Suillus subalutaceus]
MLLLILELYHVPVVPSFAISLMPPKSTQGKKPRQKSLKTPGQVGRAVEQTELPESGCSRTLSVMHEEEIVDYGSDDFDDTGSQYEQPNLNHHQPPHDDRLEDGPPPPPFLQREPQMNHAPPFQHQMNYTRPSSLTCITQMNTGLGSFRPPFAPQSPLPSMNQPHMLPPHAHQMDHNPFQQHGPQLNWTPSQQHTMTAEELFLSCSVNQPLPPPVRGADRLSRHLRDPEARPARSSPYALPGLRKVMVFGPRRQDERLVTAKKLRRNAPPRKICRRPLPPLNVSVASAQQGTPPQPLHSHDNGSAGSRLELPQQEVQLPPQPVPAERVEEVLSVNGMPSNDENIAMARTALADAIGTLPTCLQASTISQTRYICHVTHKNHWDCPNRGEVAARHHPTQVQSRTAYGTRRQRLRTNCGSCLPSRHTCSSVHNCEDASLSRSCGHGFYKDLDFNDPTALDGVIALAGAALCSALMEYKTGVYKRVEFSTAKSKDTYQNVTAYISDKIYPRVELTARFKALKDKMKERGEVRLGL